MHFVAVAVATGLHLGLPVDAVVVVDVVAATGVLRR